MWLYGTHVVRHHRFFPPLFMTLVCPLEYKMAECVWLCRTNIPAVKALLYLLFMITLVPLSVYLQLPLPRHLTVIRILPQLTRLPHNLRPMEGEFRDLTRCHLRYLGGPIMRSMTVLIPIKPPLRVSSRLLSMALHGLRNIL